MMPRIVFVKGTKVVHVQTALLVLGFILVLVACGEYSSTTLKLG